jgi:hypothetical protein
MSNPYDPPKTSTYAPSFYAGGLGGIATASIVIGAIVGKLLDAFGQYALTELAIPLIGWLVATRLLFYLIGNSNLTEDGRVLFALLLPIPACILYFPILAGTMSFLGEKTYGEGTLGPSSSEWIVASALSFLVVLMLIAVIVQVKYNVRASDARKRPKD